MNHWVLAFTGDHARENRDITRSTGEFYVSSDRTPVRRARPGDRALFYVAGVGFVAEARISAPARKPRPEAAWSSNRSPSWVICVSDLRPFPAPVRYSFPSEGYHDVLGFHRRSLTGGFLGIPRTGFEHVLDRAVDSRTEAPYPGGEKKSQGSREREKRVAGQHAIGEGRKRAALWTMAEVGASAFRLKGARRFARAKAREAEKTWLAGGKAEERVGAELERLREHGFYLFHDVPLPQLGNLDHVTLGEKGFHAIETKSHKGRVTAPSLTTERASAIECSP